MQPRDLTVRHPPVANPRRGFDFMKTRAIAFAHR
jgi:hypothetical protein